MKDFRNLVPVLASLMMAPIFAFGGQEVGNGGDILLCRAGGKVSYELFDLYEGRERHGLSNRPPQEQKNVEKMVSELIGRMKAVNPSRAARFELWLKAFFSETQFVSGVDLIDVPDTGDGFIPRGCELKQMAIQRVPRFPQEKRYVIDKDIWDAPGVSTAVKASLVLHELVLREFISVPHNQKNSIGARYLNAVLHSGVVPGSATEWLKLLDLAGLVTGDFPLEYGMFEVDWSLARSEGRPLEITPTGLPISNLIGGKFAWSGVRGDITTGEGTPWSQITEKGLDGWINFREFQPYQGDFLGFSVQSNVNGLSFTEGKLKALFGTGWGTFTRGGKTYQVTGPTTTLFIADDPSCPYQLTWSGEGGQLTTLLQGKTVQFWNACLDDTSMKSFKARGQYTLVGADGKLVSIENDKRYCLDQSEAVVACQ